MFDHSKLRRLAHEASETEMDWLDRDWLADIMADDWADYVVAIEPQVVIDLIDENERLVSECSRLKAEVERQTELRRLEWNRAEGLSKDAERYHWLRDKSESVHGFYLSVPIWFSNIRFRKEDVDNTIDTAMSQGEQANG